MDRLSRAIEAYNRARADWGRALDEYHEAQDNGADESRIAELRDRSERVHAAAEAAKQRVDEVRALNDMGDIEIARTDTSFGNNTNRQGRGNPSVNRDLSPPSLDVMHERQDILEDMMLGYQPRDRELVTACRIHPVERLFGRILLHRRRPARAGLTDAQVDAWDAYEARAREMLSQRAVSPSLGITSGDGGDLLPTFLAPRVYSAIRALGPLSGDGLVTVLTAPGSSAGGKVSMDLPTAGSISPASPKPVNMDTNRENLSTGAESLSTENYTKLVNVPSEILLGSWVNFESWVMRQVVEAFGIGFNVDRTVGDGSNKINGAFHFAAFNAANSETVTDKAAITEEELTDLVTKLPEGYHDRPNTRIMMSKATELYLARQRSNGQRLYPYMQGNNTTRGKLALPGGIDYEVNGALASVGAATSTIMGIGDFSQYAVLYGGGMRAALNHVVASDQWEMGWYWQTDGGRIIDGAFKVLRTPA